MRQSRPLRSVVFLAAVAATPIDAAEFRELGTIPGNWTRFASRADGISGDGRVVVGTATRIIDLTKTTITTDQAMRWENGVMQGLGEGIFPTHQRSGAFAASFDGSVVVGWVKISTAETQILVYDGGSITSLPDIPGGPAFARAMDVTADGSLIAGTGNDAFGEKAVTWSWPAGVPTVVDTGTTSNSLDAVSPNGSILVGKRVWGATWIGGSATLLARPTGASNARYAYGISADGTTIVGDAQFASGQLAVRWVNGVPETLGDLPNGSGLARALDASGDGSSVVGYAAEAGRYHAFIWNASSGMRKLRTVLETDGGLNLGFWQLLEATAISDDGLKVVGAALDPTGTPRGFIADLSPSFHFPGAVPHLLLDKSTTSSGDLRLTWQPTCTTGGADYGIYEGQIGDWYSHTQIDCDDDGADLSEEISPAFGDRYYLVVPHTASAEGDYGGASQGVRPPGISACMASQILALCP